MTAFICVGFDIRKAEAGQRLSADATVWDQETELYTRAKSELAIRENALQLLHPKSSHEAYLLSAMVSASENATLISLEILARVFEAYPQRELIKPPLEDIVSDHSCEILGFDVCDINGFFSFMDMTNVSNTPSYLFDEEHLLDALTTAQAAGSTDTEPRSLRRGSLEEVQQRFLGPLTVRRRGRP